MKEQNIFYFKSVIVSMIFSVICVIICLCSKITVVQASVDESTEYVQRSESAKLASINEQELAKKLALVNVETKKEVLKAEIEILQQNIELKENQRLKTVPLYNQHDYKAAYGNYGTVSSHGCGITSIAMVASYLTDQLVSPADLAKEFGRYNTDKGSSWSLFEDSAKKLGIGFQEETYDWKVVKEALKNEQVVICAQGEGLFTRNGHFIVLTGINEKGKIMVNDPNGYNLAKNQTLKNGFKEGFTERQIANTAKVYFIYEKKADACMTEKMKITELENQIIELVEKEKSILGLLN